MPTPTVINADCLTILSLMPDNSVDAVVTDPPYGLSEHRRKDIEATLLAWLTGRRDVVPSGPGGFMGHAWDRFVPPPAVWDECFRVLKPGGYLLAFAGTRTFDLMAMSIRLAGLTTDVSPEIRDSIAWLYGSGFPKSHDVSKAIDKAAGAEREVVGRVPGRMPQAQAAGWGNPGVDEFRDARRGTVDMDVTAPATDAAREWQGWGTALKPAFEPIVVARKPLIGTVAQNVLMHGTGALNVDGCRVEGDVPQPFGSPRRSVGGILNTTDEPREQYVPNPAGRWPANVVLDESQAAALDEQSGERTSGALKPYREQHENASSFRMERDKTYEAPADSGGASRFFYCAKAPKKERPVVIGEDGTRSAHPTVKPLTLMRWLVRLVTPPGGKVLDPFAGSGATGEACMLEGFESILIEREAEYMPHIQIRVDRQLAAS